MNKKMFKRAGFLHIFSLILVLLSFILKFINFKSYTDVFWICLMINFICIIKFTKKWSKEGRTISKKNDTNYNKNLTRKSSDYIFVVTICYGVMVCLIYLLSHFVKFIDFGDGMYYMTLVAVMYNYFILVAVERTANEVKLLEVSRNGGRKHDNRKN